MRDPARNVPSTHRASPIRSYVMDTLGISKPGFWADWKYRRINPYGEDAMDYDSEPDIQQYAPSMYQMPTIEPTEWDAPAIKPTEPMQMLKQAQNQAKGKSSKSSKSTKTANAPLAPAKTAMSVAKITAEKPGQIKGADTFGFVEDLSKVEKVSKVKVKTNLNRKGKAVSSLSSPNEKKQFKTITMQSYQQQSYKSPVYSSNMSGRMLNI